MRLCVVRFRLGFRVAVRGDLTFRMKTFLPALTGVALAISLPACGGGGGDSNTKTAASDPALRDKAAVLVQQAANKIVQQTPDKNLPGPKNYKVVCLEPGVNPGAKEVAENQIRCHIESFYATYKGKPGGYIWSEDWVVTAQNGKVSNPVIFGEYRIRNFLREDNKKNCTGRHKPYDCLPPDASNPPPPDQSAVPQGSAAP